MEQACCPRVQGFPNEEGKTKPATAQRNILVVRHYHIRSPNRRFGELMHQHNRPVSVFLAKGYNRISQVACRVQRFTVVDNSYCSPTRLTAWERHRILASRGALPSPQFKQRGFVWLFLCSCSWSVSSSLWCCFGVMTGSISGPPHEEEPSAAPSPVCSHGMRNEFYLNSNPV